MSEALFEHLAVSDPLLLIAILNDEGRAPSDLTFAAEIAGGAIADSALVRPPLIKLLDHASAVVREGAIYGLAHHLDSLTKVRIELVAHTDPSFAVRTAAHECLEYDAETLVAKLVADNMPAATTKRLLKPKP